MNLFLPHRDEPPRTVGVTKIMNRTIFTLQLGAALVLLASGTAMAEPRIGAVVQREYLGAVAAPNGSTASHAILYSDAVFALDTVQTGAHGRTALEFLDQTTVEVGAGAELRLDDFVYDPASTEGAGKISFAVGAFRYVGGKMTTEQNIRLYTPTATMVIRGTELVIYVWPDGRTEVNVISGAVEVSACGAGGTGKLAMTGMQVTVMPTCAVQVAAAPALPEGMAALELPSRKPEDQPKNKEDGDDDRPDRKKSEQGGKSRSHGSPPDTNGFGG